jgi:hypothetical protein
MRVWITGAHHLAAILEDLHESDVRLRAEFDELIRPGVDHRDNLLDAHARKRQVVARIEAHHPARARFRLRPKKVSVFKASARRIPAQRCEVILENKRRFVGRIANATGARVPRTQIAGRVVGWPRVWRQLLNLSLPGTLGTMRRNQNPFAGQCIPPSVRMLFEIEQEAELLSLSSTMNGERFMMRAVSSVILVSLTVLPVCSQRLEEFATPQPLPTGSTIVVGFLGGFERWDDANRSVRKLALRVRARGLANVFVETAGNHRRRTAMTLIRRAIDTDRDGHIEPEEARAARIVLYGQSWGGGAVVKAARELNQAGVPVLLTVQVDSVGLKDGLVPPNVRSAVNFFQRDPFTIRGEREIRAVDPASTLILGNHQRMYSSQPMAGSASWLRRTFGGSHAKMELDPVLWARVEQLILDAIER